MNDSLHKWVKLCTLLPCWYSIYIHVCMRVPIWVTVQKTLWCATAENNVQINNETGSSLGQHDWIKNDPPTSCYYHSTTELRSFNLAVLWQSPNVPHLKWGIWRQRHTMFCRNPVSEHFQPSYTHGPSLTKHGFIFSLITPQKPMSKQKGIFMLLCRLLGIQWTFLGESSKGGESQSDIWDLMM